MERKKGDLLLSWQKKPVGIYLEGLNYYNFKSSRIFNLRSHVILKVSFYTEVSFKGVLLEGADLEGANLYRTKLAGANLSYIKYDESTVWPEGFKRFKP